MAKEKQGEQVQAVDEVVRVAALDALEAMEQEEQQAAMSDAVIAEEVDAAEAKQLDQRLSEKERQQAAIAGAAMMVQLTDQVIGWMQPGVTIGNDEKQALISAAAPVLLKHGGGMPSFLTPYQEELSLLMVGIGVGVGIAKQIKEAREKERAAAEEKQRQQQEAAGVKQPSAGAPPVQSVRVGDPFDPSGGD